MQILHVTGGLDPSSGGPSAVVFSLTAAQALAGHSVRILTHRGNYSAEDYHKATGSIPGFEKVDIQLINTPVHGLRTRLRPIGPTEVAKALRGVDAMHMHGVWESILPVMAKAARAIGVPYFIQPHGMLDTWALERKRLKKQLALATGYRAMIKGAAAVLALSEHERQCISGGGFNDNVPIVPNGVFLEQIDPLPAPGTFRAQHPELGGDRYILFLARLHPGKGLDLLADAFAVLVREIPELRVVIAGPDFGARAPLVEQLARLGVADRVHLVGSIWDRMKFAAMADAACLCLPSEHEGFSMSIAEALACGTPVVITDLCHFPQVAQFGAGEVVKRDVPSLIEGLRRVLTSAEARRTYGAAGRRLIEKFYTWPRIAEQTAALYAGAKRASPARVAAA